MVLLSFRLAFQIQAHVLQAILFVLCKLDTKKKKIIIICFHSFSVVPKLGSRVIRFLCFTTNICFTLEENGDYMVSNNLFCSACQKQRIVFGWAFFLVVLFCNLFVLPLNYRIILAVLHENLMRIVNF